MGFFSTAALTRELDEEWKALTTLGLTLDAAKQAATDLMRRYPAHRARPVDPRLRRGRRVRYRRRAQRQRGAHAALSRAWRRHLTAAGSGATANGDE